MAPLIRPLEAVDSPAVRDLVTTRLSAAPFAEGPLEALAAALGGETGEVRALVAARGREIFGVVVFGMLAGTEGTAKLHLVTVIPKPRPRDVASRLCEAAVEEMVRLGARLMVAEMPDVPMFTPGRSLLERCGWREEARVPDLYADGVAMVLLRREPRPGRGR